jgi:preprotein translocase subunit SecA
VLVDEARTPLIISGQGEQDGLEHDVYTTAISLSEKLQEGRDFRLNWRERRVRFTPRGELRLRKLTRNLGGIWAGHHRAEQFVQQALAAMHLFIRDQHYLVAEDKVQIIDEYTGRVMPDRSWERGLHQMIEVKEGVETTRQVEPLARISYQRFFRRYHRLAGMTGTAREVAGELWAIYRMPVVHVPTNRPLQRRNLGARVYATEDEKWAAIVLAIKKMHALGRPVLIGTRSVAASEHLGELLRDAGLPHLVLNARQDLGEAEVIAAAGAAARITVATNMAGRGTDIVLAPEAEAAGGLHVIATERHEAGRIDRQLVGRGARQGDPGSYEMICALDDELMEAHGQSFFSKGPVAELVDRASAESWLRNRVVKSAQLRAERRHASVRRQLFKMDERIATMLAFSGKGE